MPAHDSDSERHVSLPSIPSLAIIPPSARTSLTADSKIAPSHGIGTILSGSSAGITADLSRRNSEDKASVSPSSDGSFHPLDPEILGNCSANDNNAAEGANGSKAEGDDHDTPVTVPPHTRRSAVLLPDDPTSPTSPAVNALQKFRRKLQRLTHIVSMDDTVSGARMRKVYRAHGKLVKHTRLAPDSLLARFWYSATLLVAAYAYVVFTRVIVFDNASNLPELILRLICSVVLILDVYVHTQVLSSRPDHIWLDVLCAIPYPAILLVVDVGEAANIVCALLPALKLLRVPFMFGRTTPDFVDAGYINFYYRWLPVGKLFFWSGAVLHTLVVLHLLATEDTNGLPDYEQYRTSLYWVSILLSSSPIPVEITNRNQEALSGLLMVASMFLQGYILGQVSVMVASYNVKDENRRMLLTTLATVQHYNLPMDVQHEILSFQYHFLEDTYRATEHNDALERLPPSLLSRIQLAVKLEHIGRVHLFDDSPVEFRNKLASVLTRCVAEPDDVIVRAGDNGDAMYFLMHGLADVSLPNGMCVATLRRGDFFGEVALLSSDCKRKATVEALTYCDLLCLHRDDFDAVLTLFPDFATVLRSKSQRRSSTLSKHVDSDVEEEKSTNDLQKVSELASTGDNTVATSFNSFSAFPSAASIISDLDMDGLLDTDTGGNAMVKLPSFRPQKVRHEDGLQHNPPSFFRRITAVTNASPRLQRGIGANQRSFHTTSTEATEERSAALTAMTRKASKNSVASTFGARVPSETSEGHTPTEDLLRSPDDGQSACPLIVAEGGQAKRLSSSGGTDADMAHVSSCETFVMDGVGRFPSSAQHNCSVPPPIHPYTAVSTSALASDVRHILETVRSLDARMSSLEESLEKSVSTAVAVHDGGIAPQPPRATLLAPEGLNHMGSVLWNNASRLRNRSAI